MEEEEVVVAEVEEGVEEEVVAEIVVQEVDEAVRWLRREELVD